MSHSQDIQTLFFAKSTDFKIYDVIIDIASYWRLHFCLFFWIVSTIKMKFGQILMQCMANISNLFLEREGHFGSFIVFLPTKQTEKSKIWKN